MNFEKFTINATLEPEHLALALARQEGGVVPPLLINNRDFEAGKLVFH